MKAKHNVKNVNAYHPARQQRTQDAKQNDTAQQFLCTFTHTAATTDTESGKHQAQHNLRMSLTDTQEDRHIHTHKQPVCPIDYCFNFWYMLILTGKIIIIMEILSCTHQRPEISTHPDSQQIYKG